LTALLACWLVQNGMVSIRRLDEHGGQIRQLVVVSVVAMVCPALGAGGALADNARRRKTPRRTRVPGSDPPRC
jgi:hypothetical protein